MIITTAGQLRSGTTWQFNAIRCLMEIKHGVDNVEGVWCDYFAGQSKKITIVKAHRPNPKLMSVSNKILSTWRDQGEILQSMKRRAYLMELHPNPNALRSGDFKNIDKYKDWGVWWQNKADYIQDFNQIRRDPESLIEDLMILFNITGIDPSTVLNKMDREMIEPANGTDSTTFLIKRTHHTMRHYLITRYNLTVYSNNEHQIKDIEKWMEGRFELFKATRDSVLSQDTPFEWIICMDSETPQRWLDLIFTDERMICSFEHPRDLTFDKGWKITTRFDSDDLYCDGALKAIQEAATLEEKVIDIRYRINDREAPVMRSANNSMFVSLVNKDSLKCVYYGDAHSKIHHHFKTERIEKVLAVRVEHGDNLMRKQGNNWIK